MRIYIHRNSQQFGPFTEAEVKTQLASGAISLLDHVWWQGQANWIPLGQSPLLAPGFTPPPDTISEPPADQTPQPTSKLAIAAVACAVVGIPLVLPEIAAIVLGHLSLAEIKKNPRLKGHGLAIGALIGGYLWLLILIVSVAIAFMTAPASETADAQANPAPSITPAAPVAPAPPKPATIAPPVPSIATPPMTPAATNSPDQSTNSAPAMTNAADQSANSPALSPTSPASSTNAPDSGTNSAPMNP